MSVTLKMKVADFVMFLLSIISWVIRQKGENPNGGNTKRKHIKFVENQAFLTL